LHAYRDGCEATAGRPWSGTTANISMTLGSLDEWL